MPFVVILFWSIGCFAVIFYLMRMWSLQEAASEGEDGAEFIAYWLWTYDVAFKNWTEDHQIAPADRNLIWTCRIYFLLFTMLFPLLILNMFIAILQDNYDLIRLTSKANENNYKLEGVMYRIKWDMKTNQFLLLIINNKVLLKFIVLIFCLRGKNIDPVLLGKILKHMFKLDHFEMVGDAHATNKLNLDVNNVMPVGNDDVDRGNKGVMGIFKDVWKKRGDVGGGEERVKKLKQIEQVLQRKTIRDEKVVQDGDGYFYIVEDEKNYFSDG